MSLDCLGANVEIGNTEIGFDFGDGFGQILQAAGGLTTGITSMVKKDQDEKKLASDDEAKLKSAIAADLAAAAALAKADVSVQLKSASAAIDKAAADSAESAQDRAASKLSSDANDRRADAADQALARAVAAAQAAPKDGYKSALVKAMTTVANKAHSGAIVSSENKGSEVAKSDSGSWFSGKTGPVPNKAIAGVGALGVAALVAKKVLHLF